MAKLYKISEVLYDNTSNKTVFKLDSGVVISQAIDDVWRDLDSYSMHYEPVTGEEGSLVGFIKLEGDMCTPILDFEVVVENDDAIDAHLIEATNPWDAMEIAKKRTGGKIVAVKEIIC